MTALVGALSGAAGRVLVANLPYLDRLTAYILLQAQYLLPGPSQLNALTDRYNEAIGRAVLAGGAELVDLRSAGLAARETGTDAALISGDGSIRAAPATGSSPRPSRRPSGSAPGPAPVPPAPGKANGWICADRAGPASAPASNIRPAWFQR
jgi:hypothetical protein